MLFFVYSPTGKMTHVTSSYDDAQASVDRSQARPGKVIDRNDFGCFVEARAVALEATELCGFTHIPTDNGPHCHPQWDVKVAPRMNDLVSRGFNGDYYPAGRIVKMSASLKRIETDDGTVFWRVKRSGAWKANGTWSMVRGHHDERNPSF